MLQQFKKVMIAIYFFKGWFYKKYFKMWTDGSCGPTQRIPLFTILIRYKNPKIKNGFEYHITQHRLQK